MGSLCAGSPAKSTSSATSTPTALPQLQDIYSRISGAASQPFKAYTGETAAGLSPTQQSGIGNINAAYGTAQPYIDKATGYATTGASPLTAADISRYSNPYTDTVINSTQANFDETNAQQQSALKGNAIASGAFGGDRAGIASAELTRQQNLAQQPVIANLRQQGFDKSLSAAQQDRAAAAAGAGTFAGLGNAAQSAALQGAGAQLTAGGVEQATNQNQLTAAYQKFMQEQAFPYQQAQFLATLGLPTATAMGSTSTGDSTKTEAYNPFSQALGLGTAAFGFLSDERVKSDIDVIGKTFDGQPIYKFRYEGDPRFQIGLMAQDVEKSNPDAVGDMGGLKTVDYDMATERAAERGGFASGGSVSPMNFMTETVGYVPTPKAPGASQMNAPRLPDMGDGRSSGPTEKQMGDFGKSAGEYFKSKGSSPLSLSAPGVDGTSFASSMSPGVSMPFSGMYSDGGLVETATAIHQGMKRARGGRAYAGGGGVSPRSRINDGFMDARTPPPSVRIDDVFDSLPNTVPNPADYNRLQDIGTTFIPPDQDWGRTAGHMPDFPMPAPRPDAIPANDRQASASPMRAALPPIITQGTEDPSPETAPMAYSGGRPPPTPFSGAPQSQGPQGPQGSSFGGFNPFGLSDKARTALIATGLGMASGRSENAISNIGMGGLHGIHSLTQANLAEQEKALQERQLGQSDQRIQMQAEQFTQRLADERRQHADTIAERRADRSERRADRDDRNIPVGWRKNAAGELEYIPKGPADPDYIGRTAEARKPTVEKALPGSAVKQLSEVGNNVETFRRLSGTFKDNYGGSVVEATGNIQNWIGRTLGAGFHDQGQWWQDYQNEKNIVRNQLFGSALTATEKVEFDRAAINPAMSAQAIRDNLARQKDAANRAARKLANAYSKGGYNKEAIEAAVGIPLSDLNETKTATASAAPKVGDRKQFKQGWGRWDGSKWVAE